VRLARKRAQQRLAPEAFESPELVEEQRPVRRVLQAWPPLAAQEQPVAEC